MDSGEERLKNYMLDVCAEFEKAVLLAETHGGLSDSDYKKACIGAGLIYRTSGRHTDAIRMFELGLKRVPDDSELLVGLAWSYVDAGRSVDGEKAAVRILQQESQSEEGRRVWKQARIQQGKELCPDIPEDRRKQIYGMFVASKDVQLLGKMSGIKDAKDPFAHFRDAAGDSHSVARNRVLQKFGIREFELDMILHEGEKEAWPVHQSADEPEVMSSLRSAMRVSEMRGSLRCAYCGKRNVASFWPEKGDWIPFYCQTKERTAEEPGAFRLRIICPFCTKSSYTVWDQNPEPLAGQLIDHIERMCNSFEHQPEAVQAINGLVSDDLLGKVLEFLRQNASSISNSTGKLEFSFETQDYFSVCWFLPVSLGKARHFIGNSYLTQLESDAQRWNRDAGAKHFVHWIYCIENGTGEANLTFLPGINHRHLPAIFATELLSPEEKAQLDR